MIQYLDNEGVFFKIKDFNKEFDFVWVLERIIAPASSLALDHETEELETLVKIKKAENTLDERDLFEIIDRTYRRLCENYKDWIYLEVDSDTDPASIDLANVVP